MKKVLFYFLFISSSFHGCAQTEVSMKIETYDQYRKQRIEPRDSLFILYTVKEWGKRDWYTWGVRSDMFDIKTEDVEYFIGGTFYSPDKKKIFVWVGEKKPNAKSLEMTRDRPELNRICPIAGDTIFSLSALIGIRDSLNQVWKLYPFNQQSATCFDSKEKVVNVLGQYYFEKMKTHQMYKMVQSGKNKGRLELTAYGYNLQDEDFWDKCWLFEKDTVGSYGLYPFQIKGYERKYYDDKGWLFIQECANPFNPPQIEYPEEILKLFK